MSQLQKILIVEDELDMAVGLKDNFEYEGYEVVVASDGEEGRALALQTVPDLILLDVMLPKLSGFDLCRELRSRGITVPIIMLTARGDEVERVVGLEIGADDYVTKPFGLRELLARTRAHLRRAGRSTSVLDVYRFGEVVLDFKRYQATRAGRPLEMTAREFEVMQYFIQHKGETITREQLLNEIWRYDSFPVTRTVDNHIAKLRQKIEGAPSDPRYIVTVHRVGYKFLG